MVINNGTFEEQEIQTCKFLIKQFKKGYGKPCKIYCEECVVCRAGRCIAFLSDHIDLIKWSQKQDEKT